MKKILTIIILICTCSFCTKAQNNNPYALVAGGSKGIGYAISEALAKRGYNLILIARHEKGLQKAKEQLETAYHINVEILAKDLADRKSASEIKDWCTERNIPLKVLCNVAGLGGANDFFKTTCRYTQVYDKCKLGVACCADLYVTTLAGKKCTGTYPKCCQHGCLRAYAAKEFVLSYEISIVVL